MKWSEIDNVLYDFTQNLTRLGSRIQVALKHQQQVYHKNHQQWYAQRVKIVRSRFRVLRKEFAQNLAITPILDDLDGPLTTLFRTHSEIAVLASVYPVAERLSELLSKTIQRTQESSFDILPRDTAQIDKRLCFVMMPFKPLRDFAPVYKAIRQAVGKAGLRCVRSDKVFDTRAIIWDIWDHTRSSRICIADTSNRNPNVFYELGLAHALPKRVVLVSRELERDEKPVFDVNYARTIFYKRSNAGLAKLKADIYKTLKTALE
jgi:hypothetical protein